MEENWPGDAPPLAEIISGFPLGAEALYHLLAVSSICGARLIQEQYSLQSIIPRMTAFYEEVADAGV